MKELTETKFVRTGREYKLEKTETGFNLRLIDPDDELKPIFKTFAQLLELSQSGQYVFSGFEEKKNEAELILLNCIHEMEISNSKSENEILKSENEILKSENETLKSENETLKSENETLKNIITVRKEVKELADSNG